MRVGAFRRTNPSSATLLSALWTPLPECRCELPCLRRVCFGCRGKNRCRTGRGGVHEHCLGLFLRRKRAASFLLKFLRRYLRSQSAVARPCLSCVVEFFRLPASGLVHALSNSPQSVAATYLEQTLPASHRPSASRS